jgi:hypothetical protein
METAVASCDREGQGEKKLLGGVNERKKKYLLVFMAGQ